LHRLRRWQKRRAFPREDARRQARLRLLIHLPAEVFLTLHDAAALGEKKQRVRCEIVKRAGERGMDEREIAVRGRQGFSALPPGDVRREGPGERGQPALFRAAAQGRKRLRKPAAPPAASAGAPPPRANFGGLTGFPFFTGVHGKRPRLSSSSAEEFRTSGLSNARENTSRMPPRSANWPGPSRAPTTYPRPTARASVRAFSQGAAEYQLERTVSAPLAAACAGGARQRSQPLRETRRPG
jgi:hypothetical protein